ncbi:E3 ubiquitin-protein ligase synoviolin B, partial [Orchesella cincta]
VERLEKVVVNLLFTIRVTIWIVLCAILTSMVVGNAFYQKKQFYPTVVYITKSKPSMAVIYAQALLFVVMMGKLFRKLFFGQLRPAEFEHLVERSWYAVTETCLAFTVFRDDFSPKFLALFTLLLFLKSFHWLAEERVDYMERSPVITWVFHVRVLSLLSLLLISDLYFVNAAYHSTMTKGASVQLVFGFEYAILTTIVMNTLAKYIFHVIDMQNETPWENKAVFVLHTEVIIGFVKVCLYVLFVMIMVRIYTLPLFALRPTYLALRSFKKALNDVIMSRRAINNMNNLYPDVTQEELANTDNVCIICREEMTGGAKKLPCNHIFHVSCLRSWFQRQQTCPTCRLNVLRAPLPGSTANVQNNAAPAAAAARNFGQFQFPGFGQQQGFPPQQAQPFAWGNIPGWPPQQQQQPAGAQQNGDNNQGQPGANAAPGANDAGRAQDANANANNAAGGGGAEAGRPQFRFNVTPGVGSANQSFPFPIPPMPYIPMVPPPPPLLQTTGLTDEELQQMEGNMRENIEARLQCLRNVQILLDSAVVQMQQYATVVDRLNVNNPSRTATNSSASTSGTTDFRENSNSASSPSSTSASTSNNNSSSTPVERQKSTPNGGTGAGDGEPPVVEKTVHPAAAGPSRVPQESASSTSSSSSTATASGINPTEQDEIRKRRLQKFTNNTTAGAQ